MENKTERKRKRRSCGGDAEGPKEKKSVLIDPEEHLRLLGVVTGQIQKLPLEDTQDECEVNTTTDTPAKRRKKKKRSGRDIPQNTKEAPNCEEKSAVDKASASEYLEQWDHDRTNWSFKKKTQYWLLQNMFFKAHVREMSWVGRQVLYIVDPHLSEPFGTRWF